MQEVHGTVSSVDNKSKHAPSFLNMVQVHTYKTVTMLKENSILSHTLNIVLMNETTKLHPNVINNGKFLAGLIVGPLSSMIDEDDTPLAEIVAETAEARPVRDKITRTFVKHAGYIKPEIVHNSPRSILSALTLDCFIRVSKPHFRKESNSFYMFVSYC